MYVYADNAATTKPSTYAVAKGLLYLTHNYGNPSSIYDLGIESKNAIADARQSIAKEIVADVEDIIFTSGGSEANNQAILGAAMLGLKNNKKHIISTKIEHHSVLNTLKRLEMFGFNITLLDVGREGIIKINDLIEAITDDTCLVTIMYANNEVGTIQPIYEIGKVCHDRGVLFHTDAVQAAGHIPINVRTSNIDMLSMSAHKFGGVKGCGVLYCRNDIDIPSLINGGGQESGRRAGTENVFGIVAMAYALAESSSCNSFSLTQKRNRLARKLITTIPNSIIVGDLQHRLPSNINICFKDIDSESLLSLLNLRGIYVSSGSACNSFVKEHSHVLKAMEVPDEYIGGALRITLGDNVTDEEIEYLYENIVRCIKELREV